MPGYFLRQAVPVGAKLKMLVKAVDDSPDSPYTARAWVVDPNDSIRSFTRAQLAKTVSLALGDAGSVHDGRVEIAFTGEATVKLSLWVERADGSTYSKRLDRDIAGPKADVWFVYCRVKESA